MDIRHNIKAVVAAILRNAGTSEPWLRRAAMQLAMRTAGQSLDDGEADGPPVPPELASYLEKVARHAWRVTDEDIEGLRNAGYTEDQIFELTTSAAAGAALSRYRIGLASLGK